MLSFQAELNVCIHSVEEAARCIMRYYNNLEPIVNAAANIALQADRDSQDIIMGELSKAFPHDGFLGEENTSFYSQLPKGGKRIWIVDPIDGTRGFAKKNGEFCIMVALVEDGVPVLGVVHDPAQSRMTYATAGGGCFGINGISKPYPCRVSNKRNLDICTLTKSHSSSAVSYNNSIINRISPKEVNETYSAGLKLVKISRGEADIYLNDYGTFNQWDVCAGHILVKEAGGKMTDQNGNDIIYRGNPSSDQGFVASNGFIHSQVLSIIQSTRQS